MRIYSPLSWEKAGVMDLVNCCLLQQKHGSYIRHDSCVRVGAQSSQAHVNVEMHSFTGLHFEVEKRPWLSSSLKETTRPMCLMKKNSLHVSLRNARFALGVETRPSYFVWDPHFLFSLIFWQPIIFWQPRELPLKFTKLYGWLGRISEHFGLHIDLEFRDWIGNLLKCPEIDLV